jgi:hypothetical protein
MAKSRKQTMRKSMSIPELRKAMQHITDYGNSLKKDKDAVKKFQREWQSTFKKPLSDKVAKEYLSHVASLKKTKGTRKQRGGSPLAAAPLSYRMEPGTLQPFGAYPNYISKGFFTPMSDNIANCGKVDSTVLVPKGMGSNLVGGKRRSKTRKSGKRKQGGGILDAGINMFQSIGMRPFLAQNPTTLQHDQMMQFKGHLASPGGQAHETTYNLRSINQTLPYLPIPNTPQVVGASVVQVPAM